MATDIQLTGTWIDVDTYVRVSGTRDHKKPIDAAKFRIDDFSKIDNTDFYDGGALVALVPFDMMIDQNANLGDRFTVYGQVTANYVTTAAQAKVNQARVQAAIRKVTTTAASWGKKNVNKTSLRAFLDLTKAFTAGTLSASDWLADQQKLLFGERDPTPKFKTYQQRLQPLISAYLDVLATNTEAALIFTSIDSLSSQVADGTPPPNPSDVHLVVVTISSKKPMRDNYKDEWLKYRKAAVEYQKGHK